MKDKKQVIEEVKEITEEEMGYKLEKLVEHSLIGAFITGVLMYTSSITAIFGSEFQMMIGLIAGASGVVTVKEAVKQALGMKYDKMSLKHLAKVEKEGIKKSERLDKKRYDKVEQLSNLISKKEKKVIIEKVLEVLSAAGVVLTALPAFVYPKLFIASSALLAALIGVTVKESLDENELFKLKVRCENLENDLYLGKYFPAGEEEPKQAKVKEQVNSERKEPVKTKDEKYVNYKQDDKPKVMQKTIGKK